MAKPKKKPEPTGSALVIDLTEAERRAIECAARDAGMPIDQYVKSLIVPPPRAAQDEDAADKAEMDEWLAMARRARLQWMEENPY